MRILGREIRWSEPPSATHTRALEQIGLEDWPPFSDIGVAFTQAQLELLGVRDEAIPAVYRSVAVISDIGSSLPLRSVGRDGIYEPSSPRLLEQPNEAEPYNATMERILTSLVLRGNAYLWPIRRNELGEIESFYVLNPDEVTVAWDRNRLFPVYSWRDQTLEPNREIFHIPINLYPGELKGLSPIGAARRMLRGVIAEQEMSRRLFEDEATPSGILEVPQKLEKEEAEAVQERWQASHGNRKRPAVLSGGVTFKPLTISPVDAQFIEQRNFGIQEIARLFGVPGILLLVSSGDSLTYSTTEGLLRMFLVTTLRPGYLEKIESVLSLMLPAGQRAVFDPRELLEPDLSSRYQSYRIGLEAGFLTIDDVRGELHLPRIERASVSSQPQTQEA